MANRRKARRQEIQAKPGQPFSLLLLILVLATGCERPSAAKLATPQEQVSLSQRAKEGAAHDSSARAAFAEGDYGRCESAYVASARLGVPTQRAQSLFGASRCAARRGRFQISLFHLHAAAAAGFGEYVLVVNDPLLRPLYGHARWQLVLDMVQENFRKSRAVEAASKERSPSGERIPLTVSFTTQLNSSNI